MAPPTYYAPQGGLPPQAKTIAGKQAIFTEAYVVIPKDVMMDIVTSLLPGWSKTRCWILARPLSGFAETFSQYIVDVESGGGSNDPEPDQGAEAVLFVVNGQATLTLAGKAHELSPGSYAYVPAGQTWSFKNNSKQSVQFHWIRKSYANVTGITPPKAFVAHDSTAEVVTMPDSGGVWSTTRFVDPKDLAHDMHVNIVNFQPGGMIPFMETHVMEHGLYVLEGEASYRLNQDWVAVKAGDFMWLRAFCPQACHAKGKGPFRYLLYKDVNRHAKLK